MFNNLQYKCKHYYLSFFAILIFSSLLNAQYTLEGPDEVGQNQIYTYVVEGDLSNVLTANWYPGAFVDPISISAPNYTVRWTGPNYGYFTVQIIDYNYNSYYLDATVTIISVPDTPANPTIQSSNHCGNSVLSRGNPPSGDTWYWQGTNPNGTSVNKGSGATYSPNEGTGTYYLRAKNSSGVWSVGSASVYVYKTSPILWYTDVDNDGFGDPSSTPISSCTKPSNRVSNNFDECPTVSGNLLNNGCSGNGDLGSTDKNYVHTITPLIEVNNVSQITNNDDKAESVTYFDGLGRVIQNVGIRSGGQRQDIKTPTIYDEFGRQAKTYLPHASTTSSVSTYTTNASLISDINTYYLSKYSNQLNSSNPNPYAEVRFDSSPLNRTLESGTPGENWLINPTSDNDHTKKYNYNTNVTEEIYRINYPGAGQSFSISSYYHESMLLKNTVKNENWVTSDGKVNTKDVFTDKSGKKIAELSYIEESSVLKTLKTYYVYDDTGNLVYVLTPKLFTNLGSGTTITTTHLNNLAFQYKYDVYNRQIEQKVPGKKQWEYMVYDQLDRPILTQDKNLKDDGKWLFTKYDAFGRAVYSGLFASNSSRSSLQYTVDSYISGNSTNLSNIESRTISTSSIGGVSINYSNNAYPTSNLEVLNVNYYDDYSFTDSNKPATPSSILGQTVTTRTKGYTTAFWTKTLEESSWSKSYTYYDEKGRVIYVYEKNHLGGFTDNKSKLDFRGKVEYTTTTHRRSTSGSVLTIQDRFEYDHIERPTTHYQQVNDNEEEIISAHVYDELGLLIKKEIGGKNIDNQLTDIVNLDVNGTSITKTYNSNSWNGGLATKSEIIGDGYVEYEIPQNNKKIMVGLSSDNSSSSFTTIDFAIYTNNNTIVHAYESGVNKGTFGSYQAGDIFRVERIGSTIKYSKNGVVFHTSSKSSTGSLIGDVSLYTHQGKIKNLKISSQFKDIENLSVDGAKITKTHNSSSWNAGLATTKEITDDGYVQYRILQTNKAIMVGLSSDNSSSHYNTIDYALYTRHDGKIYVYESGSSKGQKTTYQAGDVCKVERVGLTIYYKKNGVTFYTSTISSSGTLIGDISIHHHLGAIENLEIHSAGLQTIDYAYDIRGALKAVNDVDNIGSDLFAYELNYETGEGTNFNAPQYNGNIAQMVWKSAKNNTKKSYYYDYDDLNRFKKGRYGEGSSLTSNWQKFEVNVNGYDHNGNITGLNRKGGASGATIDNLTYYYDSGNGNQLMKIVDASGTSGFTNGATGSSEDYDYDDNGNLTKDMNKNITLIEYNHLDLVTRVVFGDGKRIEFLYDAGGSKLQMDYIVGGSTTTTHYIGGFQYSGNTLQFFPTPEGYVDYDSGAYSYVYTIRDHLGNNRVAFKDDNGDNQVNSNDILSSTDYYPMGLTHHGEYVENSTYNYKYQNKEQLLANGYKMYDFGSRMYDASVGRWFNVDPQNQFWSPYLAMGNIWVVSVDPNGEWVHLVIGFVVGGIINTATNWDNISNGGGSFWDKVGRGASYFGVGGVAGVVTAATGNPVLGGAILGGGNSAVTQYIQTGTIDPLSVANSAFIGGATSFLGGQIAPVVSKFTSPLFTNANSLASKYLSDALSNTITGVSLTTFSGVAQGQSFGDAFQSGIDAIPQSLAISVIGTTGSLLNKNYVNKKIKEEQLARQSNDPDLLQNSSRNIPAENNKYAFGMKPEALALAKEINGEHLMSDENFKHTFKKIIFDNNSEIHFSLDGGFKESNLQQVINRPHHSSTNWELNMLYNSPAFERTIFHFQGATYRGYEAFKLKL